MGLGLARLEVGCARDREGNRVPGLRFQKKKKDPLLRRAIEHYAKRAGVDIVEWFYDPAVSGTDPIESRPGLAAMLERIAGNGVRTIIVETANRFARDLMVQEVGFARLRKLGVTLIAADSPTAFLDDTPTAKLVRQLLGAVSEFDKTMLVAKLKAARDRKIAKGIKCGGRKSYEEANPELVRLALELARPPAGFAPNHGPSLRKVSAELAARGYVTQRGLPYSASAVKAMLGLTRSAPIAATP
jgi:DNA invertase Pin-like site-specific DNA recombinase